MFRHTVRRGDPEGFVGISRLAQVAVECVQLELRLGVFRASSVHSTLAVWNSVVRALAGNEPIVQPTSSRCPALNARMLSGRLRQRLQYALLHDSHAWMRLRKRK